jgi:UDP-N-acetylmuramate dehydrogenase
MNEAQQQWLKDNLGDLVAFDEPMSKHTTFKIGGPANLVTVKTDAQLQKLARWAHENHQPLMILGAGSNVLVRDEGIEGLVLKLANGFESIDSDTAEGSSEFVKVKAGAGNLVRELGRYALNQGLEGLNFTLGIPGTVGGALRMNAGAWGSCMADTVWSVSVLDTCGDIVEKKKKDLPFRYRSLDLEEGAIILRGVFALKQGDRDALRKEAAQLQKKRVANQPLSDPSAGSIFRNPSKGLSAGELIEKAGMKGLRSGDAEISKKHANFIVNKGNAKASDVMVLIKQVQQNVFKQFGITLEPEVIIIG